MAQAIGGRVAKGGRTRRSRLGLRGDQVAVIALALLAGLVILAMPGDLLAILVHRTAPGVFARIAAALLGAGAITALMLAVFRAPLPAMPRRARGKPRPPAYKVRRADAHPDAPPRRPLFAQDEIGEPWHAALAPEPDVYARAVEPGAGVKLDPVDAPGVAALLGRLETGLAGKASIALERSAPHAIRDDDHHPSPAIRQQRELGAALRDSLDMLGQKTIARG